MNTINYYYTPQKRERVIFIGNRKGLKNYHPKPILQSSQYITTGTAIADLMEMPENKEFNHVPTKPARIWLSVCLNYRRDKAYTKVILMLGKNARGTKHRVRLRKTMAE